MKSSLTSLLFVLVSITITAQNQYLSYNWSKKLDVSCNFFEKDNKDNLIIIGQINKETDFDPSDEKNLVIPLYENSIFIAKYTNFGKLLWVNQLPQNLEISKLAIDNKNNISIAGNFSLKVDFDYSDKEFFLTSNQRSNDGFLLTLNEDGNFKSVIQYTGRGNVFISDIKFDEFNNILLTGWFKDSIDFDPSINQNVQFVFVNPDNNQGSNIFVTKLNENQELIWVQKFMSSFYYNDYANSIALDSSSNIYITGYFSREICLIKLDRDGQLLWKNIYYASTKYCSGNFVIVDKYQYIYFSFNFQNNVIFNSINLSSTNGNYGIAKIDPDGKLLWVKQFFMSPSRIQFDSSDNLYIGSSSSGKFDIDISNGEKNFNSANNIYTLTKSTNEGILKWWVSSQSDQNIKDLFVVGNDQSVYVASNFSKEIKVGGEIIDTTLNGGGDQSLLLTKYHVCNEIPKPTIQQDGYLLKSNYPQNNKWYLDGRLIENAIDSIFLATKSGDYKVKVFDSNECYSEYSDKIHVEVFPYFLATVAPNPARNHTNLILNLNSLYDVKYELVNSIGIIYLKKELGQRSGNFSQEIDLSELPFGVYFLKCFYDNSSSTFKIIHQ